MTPILSYTTDKWHVCVMDIFGIICELQKCAKITNTQKIGNDNVFDKLTPMWIVCKTTNRKIPSKRTLKQNM